MNFITFDGLNQAIMKNLEKVPVDVDLIVGIPRSGLMTASMLALYKNLPFCDLESVLAGRIFKTGTTRKSARWITKLEDARHILVIDDSISTGEALNTAKAQLAQSGLTCKITYCAVLALPTNFNSVDIYFEICNHPRMFEWNYMHHWGLKHCCVDIDGVLCEDPSYWDNDDGPKYRKFLLNARPKIIPTMPIGYLVTSRLAKYREETESWLKKHGVEYDHLIMLEGVDAATRRREGGHGKYKAEIYKKTDCFLFIESAYEQAVDICSIAEKPVYCVENSRLIETSNKAAHIKNLANDWKITTKRVIRKLLAKR